MSMFKRWVLLILLLNLSPLFAAQSSITIEGNYRIIHSDGIPNHTTGRFPNSGNPNRISKQSHEFRVALQPVFTSRTTKLGLWPFGVAINGIPFDPGAAEFWNNDRRSGWQYEALSGAIPLGVDDNNAHVQRNGTYHYHGIPTGLVRKVKREPVMLGYAADGFPIYGSHGHQNTNDNLQPSYRIKSGQRNGGPGGKYDGSFIEDYEYVAGLGDLDECNGRQGVTPEYPKSTYYYVITDKFPSIPRCFKGTPDQSFKRMPAMGRPAGGRGPGAGRQGPEGGGPDGRRGPPQEAIDACKGRRSGDQVSFQTPRGETKKGICQTRHGKLFAIPKF